MDKQCPKCNRLLFDPTQSGAGRCIEANGLGCTQNQLAAAKAEIADSVECKVGSDKLRPEQAEILKSKPQQVDK